MKRFMLVAFVAALLCSCGGDEPNVYDKVSGHTYAMVLSTDFGGDTITFNSNGTIAQNLQFTWEQEHNLVSVYRPVQDKQFLDKAFQVYDKKIVLLRNGAVYRRLD